MTPKRLKGTGIDLTAREWREQDLLDISDRRSWRNWPKEVTEPLTLGAKCAAILVAMIGALCLVYWWRL